VRRTIFGKLLKVFFIVLLIGALISGVMLNFFLKSFITADIADSQKRGTQDIIDMLDFYNENGATTIDQLYFKYALNMTSRTLNSIIFILNKDGEIISLTPSYDYLSEDIVNKFKIENDSLKLPEASMYKDIVANGKVFEERVGDYKGFFKDTGYLWFTYGKPYMDKDNNVLGAVIMSTSLPEAMKLLKSVVRLFLLSSFVAMIISFALIYVLSLKITLPIRAINNAVRVIANGKFDKRIEYITDDEIGELAISFNQMGNALENFDKMRSDFIANVSHDLRTPMTSIGGFIEGILDGTIPEEKQKYYLGIVRDEIKRLNGLISNILDLAKMEAGEFPLSFSTFDINEVIRRSVISFQGVLIEKDIDVNVEFDSEETYVDADKDAIERVLVNLLHNAIKFIGENEKRIDIKTSVHKDKVTVKISDTGIGISEEEQKFIWERFHKADKSRNKDKVGTGLGLSIVRTLINEHGQDIKVESEKGKGSSFIFTLKYISMKNR
jgi:signal transduction histidine kinase